jgi:hypothetical protein
MKMAFFSRGANSLQGLLIQDWTNCAQTIQAETGRCARPQWHFDTALSNALFSSFIADGRRGET